jgi:hypothetical protein
MLLDPRRGHFAYKQRIKLIAQGNQPDVGGVTFVAGARVSKSDELNFHTEPF